MRFTMNVAEWQSVGIMLNATEDAGTEILIPLPENEKGEENLVIRVPKILSDDQKRGMITLEQLSLNEAEENTFVFERDALCNQDVVYALLLAYDHSEADIHVSRKMAQSVQIIKELEYEKLISVDFAEMELVPRVYLLKITLEPNQRLSLYFGNKDDGARIYSEVYFRRVECSNCIFEWIIETRQDFVKLNSTYYVALSELE